MITGIFARLSIEAWRVHGKGVRCAFHLFDVRKFGRRFPDARPVLELRGRGHKVTFATNEHYAGMVQGYGLPFEPLGDKAAFAACITNPDLWRPGKAFQHVFEHLRPTLKRQYEIHAEQARSGPVVGISNCLGMGALIAQDKLGIPVITLHCQPSVVWSDREPPLLPGMFGPNWCKSLIYRVAERFIIDPVVCPFLNSWRKELGLPPVKQIFRWWHSRYGVLCLFPAWYAQPQVDWPAGVMLADFPLWNHQANKPIPLEVETFLQRGDPPLVFTPGSTNLHGRAFFEAAVWACQTLNRRGILLTEFPEQLPNALPDSVAHFAYVPLDVLLPRAAAFIHHGGVGSTSQAMLAGIPQVLMPLAHDQFDNAARVCRLGLGRSVPARRFTGPRLVAALKDLLDRSAIRESCQDVARRLEAKNGLQLAADAVERRITGS